MNITDEKIVEISHSVDKFVHTLMDDSKLDIIDIAAVIGSRLRALSVADELEEDYDALQDHMVSQTILVCRTVH